MQSILRNYMAWIVMAVLMIGFLVIQFALVESRRARTMQENKKPVDTLKQAETMRRGDGSLPTEGDLRAAVALQTGVRIGHRDIVQDLRRFSCGLDAYMAGDPNNEPNDALRGSKTLEIMRPGTGIPGPAGSGKRVDVEPIPWSMFAVTLRRLYDDMVEESRRLLLKAREKRLREALADQYFAADRLMTREKADEHAAVVARAEAERQVDALLAGARDLNPIRGGIDERYNPSDESHLARGWNNWRRYLVMRDLLLDVLPTAMAEVDATYWAANPVDEGQRERYVKHFMADDGDRQPPSDIVMTPASVRWERKTARFIDSFRVEGLDLAPEVGNVALPSRADMERPEPPKIPDSGQAFDR